MSKPDRLMALDLPEPTQIPDELKPVYGKAVERLGFVPNVLRGYAHSPDRLRNFLNTRDTLMAGESGLSVLEREMIAVVVSTLNRCYYCLTSHSATVRKLSGDALLGDLLVMNFRAGELPARQCAMLEFAKKLTEQPQEIVEADRQGLRDAGFGEKDIWDIIEVTAFFNMTNRLAAGTEMVPNPEYHRIGR